MSAAVGYPAGGNISQQPQEMKYSHLRTTWDLMQHCPPSCLIFPSPSLSASHIHLRILPIEVWYTPNWQATLGPLVPWTQAHPRLTPTRPLCLHCNETASDELPGPDQHLPPCTADSPCCLSATSPKVVISVLVLKLSPARMYSP